MEITGAAYFTFLAFGVVPVLRADRGGLDYFDSYGSLFAVVAPYDDIFQVCRVPVPEYNWYIDYANNVFDVNRKLVMKFILVLRLQGLARYK